MPKDSQYVVATDTVTPEDFLQQLDAACKTAGFAGGEKPPYAASGQKDGGCFTIKCKREVADLARKIKGAMVRCSVVGV